MNDSDKHDLLLAILAMDSYNRGYGAGLADGEGELTVDGFDADGLGGIGSKIGDATFLKQSDSKLDSPEVAAGFYAAAYQLPDGEVVISYRGTEPPPSPCKPERMKASRHALAGRAPSPLHGRA